MSCISVKTGWLVAVWDIAGDSMSITDMFSDCSGYLVSASSSMLYPLSDPSRVSQSTHSGDIMATSEAANIALLGIRYAPL